MHYKHYTFNGPINMSHYCQISKLIGYVINFFFLIKSINRSLLLNSQLHTLLYIEHTCEMLNPLIILMKLLYNPIYMPTKLHCYFINLFNKICGGIFGDYYLLVTLHMNIIIFIFTFNFIVYTFSIIIKFKLIY